MYYTESFERCKGDARGTWRLLNDMIVRRGRNRNIESIVVNDIEITDPNEMANKFNSFFANIAHEIDSNLPHPVNDPIDSVSASTPDSFYIFLVTPNEIINVVHALKNKSYGLHSLSTKIFKIIIQYVCIPLSCIVNDSIDQGIFPNILKKASVTPVFKSGSEKDMHNYRPISALPLLSKVLRSV